MPETRSINQNIPPKLLPNFRQFGHGVAHRAAGERHRTAPGGSQAASLGDMLNSLLQGSALLQPVLLTSLLLLYALNPVLGRMPYWQGMLAVLAVVAAVTVMIDLLGGDLFSAAGEIGAFRYIRHALVSIAFSLILLSYFRLRAQALSPAKHEARLQALQARIRPHFLFNTINAVLSIVRTDPKRAETALEDMADLFRMAMTDQHELVVLSKEVELARQYLAIEELRLGERLQVRWDTQNMPPDALIPPLILQPLLENAVYHGIEPLPEGGTIDVRLYRDDNELHLEVSNPARKPSRVADSGQQDGALQHPRTSGLAVRRRSAIPGRERCESLSGSHSYPLRERADSMTDTITLPLTVFIVDDETPARNRLKEMLADCAAQFPLQLVGEAGNGQEALDKLAETPAEVVLMDIRMPQMDGIELARHLNKLEHPPAHHIHYGL